MTCENKLHYKTVTPLLKETLGILMSEELCIPFRLVERKGAYGRFYGCSDYPKCKFTHRC